MKAIATNLASGETTQHFTPEELASRWNFCLETMRRMLRRGDVAGLKFGRSWRIPRSAVEEYERGSRYPGRQAKG
jgi:excisionase family DNA binding protein